MKRSATLGLAVTASFLSSGATAAATASTAQAAAWLRSHSQPQQDELAELRAENPSAYAIVKALLTKRSLGLLDPRHPSPSFSAAAPPPSDVPGVEAFAKIAQESGEKPNAALAYPEAAAVPAHHDWLNWKPQQSAVEDVTALAGDASANEAPKTMGPPPPPPADVPAAPAEQHASGENSYLKDIDFFGDKPAAQRKPAHSLASQDSHDYLASFSWDDDKPAAPKKVVESSKPEQEHPQAGGAPKNALLSWLGGGQGPKGGQSFLSLDA